MTDTTTALEHRTPGKGMLDFDDAVRYSTVLAKSDLVPKALQGNPNGVMLVGLLGQELGVPFVSALSEIHVIENRPSPSAQLRLALIRRAGHEARFVESSETRAVIRARRAENSADPDGWVQVEWTIEQARKAGLVDRWVERWVTRPKDNGQGTYKAKEMFVVGDDTGIFNEAARRQRGLPVALPEWAQTLLDNGEVRQKDNWAKYTAEMLRARCSSAICRMEFSDVLLGMQGGEAAHLFTPEEMGHDSGQDVDDVALTEDEDIVEGELVEDDEQDLGGGGTGEAEAQPTAPPAEPPAAEQDEPDTDPLLSKAWRSQFAINARNAGLSDDERHCVINTATRGRTATSTELRRSDVDEVVRWFDAVTVGEPPPYRFLQMDGGLHIGPRSAEGDAAGQTLFEETA